MPATFTAKFNFAYGWFLGEDPGVEPLDFQTKALDALVPDAFGQNVATTAGLTYGYRGGWIYNRVTTLPVKVVAGVLNLPANKTCYIQRNQAGVVSFSEVGFSADLIPMSIAVTNNFEIITIEDARVFNGEYANRVTSVFGRTQDILAVAGDYNAMMITLMDGAAKARYSVDNVQALLNALASDMVMALVSDVKSFGPYGGPTRTGNIVTQYGDYSADLIAIDNAIPGVDFSGIANPTVEDAIRILSALGRVTKFNGRTGDIVPTANDYSCVQVSYEGATVTKTILFPPGVIQGNTAQNVIDALKVHFHDATQITMSPSIFPGAENVQQSLQWLKDNGGGGNGALTITTSSTQLNGTAPYSINLALSAYGGTPANYIWSITSTTIPGAAITGQPGAKAFTATVLNPGTYTATIHLTDGVSTTDLNLVVVTTGAVSSLVVTTSTPLAVFGYDNKTSNYGLSLAYSGGTGASDFSALVHGDTTTGINWTVAVGNILHGNIATTNNTSRSVTCRVRATDSVNVTAEKILTFNVTYAAKMTIAATVPASIVVTSAASQTVAVPLVTTGGHTSRTVELYSAISGWGASVNLGNGITATVSSATNIQINYADTTTSSSINLSLPIRVTDAQSNVESDTLTLSFQKQSTLAITYTAPPSQNTANASPYTFGPPTVSGGSGSGYTYSLVSVTDGQLSKFSINPATGVVTYIPSTLPNVATSYAVIIEVRDSVANAKTVSVPVAITAQVFANAPNAITPTTVVKAYASPYLFVPLTTTGGTAPDFTWAIDSVGTLPGTPTIVLVNTTYNLRVAAPNTDTQYTFSIKATNTDVGAAFTVTPMTLSVTAVASFNLTNVGSTTTYTAGTVYPQSWQPTFGGAAGHVTLTVVSITPSTGLTYTKDTSGACDTIRWSSTVAQVYTVVVTATDNVTTISNQTFYVNAAAAVITPTITTTTPKTVALPDASTHSANFAFNLTATGGSGFVWAQEGSASFVNATGTAVLTGAGIAVSFTVTDNAQNATCTQTFRATNSTGGTITKSIQFRVTPYVAPVTVITNPTNATVTLYANSDGATAEVTHILCEATPYAPSGRTWEVSSTGTGFTVSVEPSTGYVSFTPTGSAVTVGGVYTGTITVTVKQDGVVMDTQDTPIVLNVTMLEAFQITGFTVSPSSSSGQHYANFAATIVGAPGLVVVKENGIVVATLSSAGGNTYVGSISMSQYMLGWAGSGGFVCVASFANGSRPVSSSTVDSSSYKPLTGSVSASVSGTDGRTLTYGMTTSPAGANAGTFTITFTDNQGEILSGTSTTNPTKLLSVVGTHSITGYIWSEAGTNRSAGTVSVNVSIVETGLPVIAMTSLPAASYAAGVNITIGATATDVGSGISSFALFVDGVSVASNTTGLELTHVISGTAQGVNHSYYLVATDRAVVPNTKTTDTQNITITAVAAITAPSLPTTASIVVRKVDGNASTTFSKTITATGGVAPYAWSAVGGAYPPFSFSINPSTGALIANVDTFGSSDLIITCTSTGGTPGGVGSSTQTLTLNNYDWSGVVVDPNDPNTWCFTEDTFVLMSDGSAKLIKDIKEGDVHVSVKEGTLELCSSTAYQICTPHMSNVGVEKEIRRFEGIGVTANHPFGLMDCKFKMLFELNSNCNLVTLDENGEIGSKFFSGAIPSSDCELVYNFETTEHSYFVGASVNGPWFLVHNPIDNTLYLS